MSRQNLIDCALLLTALGVTAAAVKNDWLFGGYFLLLFVILAVTECRHD